MRVVFPLAVPLAMLFASGNATAQSQDADAERLFREGQKLMEERRFGEACPKFEAAYTKDRQLGTLINLAFCHKEQGAIWYAWLEFREAEVKATELNRPDRRDFAKQRLAELEKQLPKVVLDNPQHMPLTDVLVEDRKVWEAERGAVFAVEAGQRKFVFRAKGKKQASALINVVKGDKAQHVVVPDMEDGGGETPPPPPPPTGGNTEPPKPEAPSSDSHPGSTQKTIGWVGIGVGGVALAIGAFYGIKTFSSPCANGKKCPTADQTDANRSGTISNIAFVLAGIGVIGGGVLILTAPSAPQTQAKIVVSPQIGAGWAGLTGTF